MMKKKKILFVRHAKSDWSSPSLADIDRPLNNRGQNDAPEMGKRLRKQNQKPQRIFRSPSVRTTQTIDLLVKNAGWSDVDIKEKEWLYLASRRDYLSGIEEISNKHDYICLCAHNPGITDIVNHLSGEYISNMPTCAVALIEFETDNWKEVSGGTGKLLHFDYPKNR